MPPETRPSPQRGKIPPRALVLSQVERILSHQSFRDHPKLPELLRYLVEIDHSGRFDPPFSPGKLKPIGKLIVDEFYRDCFPDDQPRDTGPSGKKLVGQLRKKLKAYYGEHPTLKTHGRVKIEILEGRGTSYRPQIKWLDEPPDGNLKAAHSSRAMLSSASILEDAGGNRLAELLNARLSFLNDPEFGHEMARYFDFAASHGIYCHDLRTTFTLREVDLKRYPASANIRNLAATCFDLAIKEAVDKVCAPDRLRFAAFLHAGFLAHHFTKPEFDFAWQIDLPNDAAFTGNLSELFRIDLVEVDGSTIIAEPSKPAGGIIRVLRDDNREFLFEIDIATLPAHGRLRKLRYAFHTLKAKDYRFVSHGTRVLTRGMTIKVDFGSETGIEAVHVQPSFSGDDSPKPSEFEGKEISVSGWLLPRSGATFSFRYDKPYRK